MYCIKCDVEMTVEPLMDYSDRLISDAQVQMCDIHTCPLCGYEKEVYWDDDPEEEKLDYFDEYYYNENN